MIKIYVARMYSGLSYWGKCKSYLFYKQSVFKMRLKHGIAGTTMHSI